MLKKNYTYTLNLIHLKFVALIINSMNLHIIKNISKFENCISKIKTINCFLLSIGKNYFRLYILIINNLKSNNLLI
jgi:hypothetical protein